MDRGAGGWGWGWEQNHFLILLGLGLDLGDPVAQRIFTVPSSDGTRERLRQMTNHPQPLPLPLY